MNLDFFHLASVAAAVLAVAGAGCFDRKVPQKQVIARSEAEAATNLNAVTFLDLHATGPGSEPLVFPANLASMPVLERLSVRGRSLVGGVPEDALSAKNLQMLDLAGTGIKDLPQSLAKGAPIRQLYLSDNSIVVLPPVVSDLKLLEYLNLDRNALESLPELIGELGALKWARFNYNRLSDLPESAATGWRSIRKLYLRGNGLKQFPSAILKMESLEELDLGENDLTEIPPEICSLPNLHRIDLDSNPHLTTLPENIGEMKSLTHLFVFRCALPDEERARVRAALPDPVRQFIAF